MDLQALFLHYMFRIKCDKLFTVHIGKIQLTEKNDLPITQVVSTVINFIQSSDE
jgi:hypothetical protein